MTTTHAHKRIVYALQHLPMAPEDWKQIFWMDEKVFSSSKDGRMQVWRLIDKRLKPKYVIAHERSGRMYICGISRIHSDDSRYSTDDGEATSGCLHNYKLVAAVKSACFCLDALQRAW